MKLAFYKYQGSGNDFILVDNRKQVFKPQEAIIRELCDRHFGIGADGLMLLLNDADHDFAMKYYNADGREGSMCGNGGRCISLFAYRLGITGRQAAFNAIDGVHHADILSIDHNSAQVKLQINPVSGIKKLEDGYFLDTGSPHFVQFVSFSDNDDIISHGKRFRYDSRFSPDGTNVNFVGIDSKNRIKVRTYERGVENETLSCGTGVTASAIAAYFDGKIESNVVNVLTPGGELVVMFESRKTDFVNIHLQGPATEVFKGEVIINE